MTEGEGVTATPAAGDSAQLKKRALAAIGARRDEVIALADEVWREPELGFREERTAARVAAFLRRLGLTVRTGLALTGVKAVVRGRGTAGQGRPPCVAVLGELDALVCPEHPAADPATGAAHACGHHAQLAVMVGAAVGLTAPGIIDALGGAIAFMAVPAEEYVEIEARLRLRAQGRIEFLGGKPELIRLGELDDVDMAILVHAGASPGSRMTVGGTSNGFIGKFVRYFGREAHAGSEPWLGGNALSSAVVAISAVNALRETFNESDFIRVHPIITKGGDLVNIVPADVRLETYVRGRTMEAVREASAKVNQAFKAGALAIGTRVEIRDLPGFLPMLVDAEMASLFRRNLEALVGVQDLTDGGHMAASTDMGDVSHIMPVIHPYGAGMTGRPHSPDFAVVDPDLAYIRPAEAVALTVIDLLADGARKAEAVREKAKPPMTRSQYVEFARSLFHTSYYPDDLGGGAREEVDD